jgi:hypothetical protein
MPDTKITALAAITTVAPAADLFPIVDVSDNSMAASGTTKNITVNQLLGAGGTATLASATITGDLTVDTSTLKVDSTNNRVGILTASPAQSLDVASGNLQVRTGGTVFSDTFSNYGAALAINAAGSLPIRLQIAGTTAYEITSANVHTWSNVGGVAGTAMTLNSTGLGVGGSPIGKFSVIDSTLTGTGQLREQVIRAAADNTNNSLNSLVGFTFSTGSAAYTAGSLVRSAGVYGINLDNSAFGRTVGLSFYTCAQDAAATEKMRIDNSGNVGIGVTPSAWGSAFKAVDFGTVGGMAATGVATRFTNNSYNNGTNFIYKASSVAACLYELNAGEHRWFTAPSGTAGNPITGANAFVQNMTLDASGNLLVGVTSAGGNRLNVQTASGDCLMLVKSQAANTNLAIDYVSNYGNYTIRKSGTAVWDYGVISDSSATPAFKIQNASSVGVQLVSGATAWTTLSDETMKDIIEPISNAVAKVGSLRSVIGKFKTDDASKRRSFLIAQDVQSVLPEAVDVIGENNELGLRYTEVIPLLVAAIKELTAEVNALKKA